MSEGIQGSDQEAKFKALFEKARRGVVKRVVDRGGSMSLSDMHEYSLNTYFIQHQRFSQLMETLVEEKLVDYDAETQTVTVTEAGRAFAQ